VPNWRDKSQDASGGEKFSNRGKQFSHFTKSTGAAGESSGRNCWICGSSQHLSSFHKNSGSGRTNRVRVVEDVDTSDVVEISNMFDESADNERLEIKRVSLNVVNKHAPVLSNNICNVSRSVNDAIENVPTSVDLFVNNKLITGVYDSGAQISVLARCCLTDDFDLSQSGQTQLCGAFGQRVTARLINLPCRLNSKCLNSSDENVLLTIAVTDKLEQDQMLISADDYKVLQEHEFNCKSIPQVRVVNGSKLLLNSELPVPHNETIVFNKDFCLTTQNPVCDNMSISDCNMDPIGVRIDNVHVIKDGVSNKCELMDAQKSDQTLDKIRNDALNPNSQYFFRDGILYRRAKINDLLIDQLIVPKDKRVIIIEKAHDSVFGGHFASRKTLQKISHVFWWPGIKKHVQSYVNSCLECSVVAE
jgi:hypothetical protein